MATYNYVANNPSITNYVDGQQYIILFETENEGPATLYFTPADTPVIPILNLQEQPLTGGELNGGMTLVYIEAQNAFILLGASPVVPPGSITGAEVAGSTAVNLIQDPLFQYNQIYWNFSNAGLLALDSNLAPSGVSGLYYKNGSIGNRTIDYWVISSTISVIANTNYIFQGYIDATGVISSGTAQPEWIVTDPTLTTTYATAQQTSGVAGLVVAPTFQFPSNVSEVVVVFTTASSTIEGLGEITATSPLLEIGSAQPVFTTSYNQQSGSTSLTGLYGTWSYSQLNPPTDTPSPTYTPSTASGGSLTTFNGATGSDSWSSTAYSGDNGLQVQAIAASGVGGGVVVINSNMGIEYTVTGNEVFSMYYQVTDNTPDLLAIGLYTSASSYLGAAWGNLNSYKVDIGQFYTQIGTIPISKNQWIQVIFTAAQIGIKVGTEITGLVWVVAAKANTTSTIIFSNFGSSTISSNPNYSLETASVAPDAITVPAESILTTPIMAGGNSAQLQWVSGSAYVPGNLILDSNNNGEICSSAIQIDLTGQQSPTTCFAHFLWVSGGVATPTGSANGMNAAAGSASAAGTNIIAIAPATSGVFPDIVGSQQVAPSTNQTSVTIPSGSPTAGNNLLATIALSNLQTVTAPSGWSQVTTTSAAPTVVTFYKLATASEPTSYLFSWGTSTAVSAALFEIFGGNGVNASNENRSATSSISVPSITPSVGYCLCYMAYAFVTSGKITTLPAALSASSAPTWAGSVGGLTQDNAIVWENIGPNYPYDQWVTIALPVNLPVNAITDYVDMFVTDSQYSTSNMAIGDSMEIQFIDQNGDILAQGIASVVAFSSSSSTSAQSSSQGAGILIHKRSMGILTGNVTVTAQIRARNGSGNGIFSFALVEADVEIQDNKK